MEQNTISLAHITAVIRRRFWLVYYVGAIILLLLLLYIARIPFVYQSESMLALEPPETASNISGSGEVLEKKVQLVKSKILSREHLTTIVNELGLKQPDESIEDAVNKLRDSIAIEPISAAYIDPKYGLSREATVALRLANQHQNPQRAYDIALRVLTDFLSESQTRTSKIIENKSKVLSTEVNKQGEAIDELERKIAVFKSKHADKLPEFRDFNLDLLNQQQQQLMSIDQELTQARQQKAMLSAQLGSTSRYSSLKSTTTGESILNNNEKLRSLQVQLAEARRKYTADHPDVKRLSRQLEAARSSADDVAAYEASVPTKADNPAYISLRSQVSAMNSRINSLGGIRSELASKVSKYEKSFQSSPEIEREYNSMVREYDNRKSKYSELKNQLSDAEIAENVNRLSSGDKLSVIERASLPIKPEKPNKMILTLLAAFAAGCIGVIVMIFRELMDGTIKDSYELADITGAQPLAVVRDMNANKYRVVGYTFAFVIFAIVVITALYANNKFTEEFDSILNASNKTSMVEDNESV